MRAPAAPLLALLPCVVALAAAGCPADPCAEDEPAYGGLGNDEVWLALKDAKASATAGDDAPTVTAPAAGAALPAGETPTFAWESPLKVALGPALESAPLFRARRSLLDDTLGRVIDGASALLVPPAHAHLPPVSSDVYLAEVLVPGRACPVSIVTSELSHELDADTWAILKESAGQELTLQLTSAYLAAGRVTEGPFKAPDVTFTVE